MDTLATRSTIFLRLKSDETGTREIAWSDFNDRYAPIIAAFARKLSVRAEDVDDVIQDVLLGFFSHAPAFIYDPSKGRFRGYLKVCTFRAMQRRLGAKLKLHQVPLDQVELEHVEVEQVWNDVWELEMLGRALEETRREFNDDPAFRAFELHVIEGMPIQDVVRALQLSESTIYRARARVAASLKEKLHDVEDLTG